MNADPGPPPGVEMVHPPQGSLTGAGAYCCVGVSCAVGSGDGAGPSVDLTKVQPSVGVAEAELGPHAGL